MKKLLLILLSVCFVLNVQAQRVPVLELFHGAECPHCHDERKWLPTLVKMYPGLEIKEYEVWHDTNNQLLFQQRLQELNKESQAVPTNIIGKEVIVGFNKAKIKEVMKAEYGDPFITEESLIKSEESESFWSKIIAFFKGLFG